VFSISNDFVSPRDSGPFYDILNLADVTDIFVANSISQSVANDAH